MSGSGGAVERLLAQRARYLGFARRLVGDAALAEDLVQTALLRIAEGRAAPPEGEGAGPWFARVLRNLAVDAHRRRAAGARAAAAYAADPAVGPGVPATTPGAPCQCVAPLAAALPPAYAEAVRRVDLTAQVPADAARALGVSRGHLGVRLHRARRALRERVRQVCGACAAGGCRDCTCAPGDAAGRV